MHKSSLGPRAATRRLQQRGSERIAESYGDELWRHIDHILHTVTSEVVAYADQFENPVLVLEDLTHIRENMDYGAFMNRRLHGWGFDKMHAQIRYKATERGIRVETVTSDSISTSTCGTTTNHPTKPVTVSTRVRLPRGVCARFGATSTLPEKSGRGVNQFTTPVYKHNVSTSKVRVITLHRESQQSIISVRKHRKRRHKPRGSRRFTRAASIDLVEARDEKTITEEITVS